MDVGGVYAATGATSCLLFSCKSAELTDTKETDPSTGLGAAYGTAQAGIGVCRGASRDASVTIKGIIPVAMAGVRGIYGLVLSIIILASVSSDSARSTYSGMSLLSGGLCCGIAQLASGITVGVVGESLTEAIVVRKSLFAPAVLILIFSEALALYGLISGMILVQGA